MAADAAARPDDVAARIEITPHSWTLRHGARRDREAGGVARVTILEMQGRCAQSAVARDVQLDENGWIEDVRCEVRLEEAPPDGGCGHVRMLAPAFAGPGAAKDYWTLRVHLHVAAAQLEEIRAWLRRDGGSIATIELEMGGPPLVELEVDGRNVVRWRRPQYDATGALDVTSYDIVVASAWNKPQ